jgi:hypothetical protein
MQGSSATKNWERVQESAHFETLRHMIETAGTTRKKALLYVSISFSWIGRIIMIRLYEARDKVQQHKAPRAAGLGASGSGDVFSPVSVQRTSAGPQGGAIIAAGLLSVLMMRGGKGHLSFHCFEVLVTHRSSLLARCRSRCFTSCS